MAIELVNIGRIANDGTGDDLREAFVKINRSLEDLDLRIDDRTEGVNLGTGEEVFKGRNGYDLEFRTLEGGTNTTVRTSGNNIIVDVNDSIVQLPVISDSGSIILEKGDSIRINGGVDISTVINPSNNQVTINNTKVTNINEDPNPTLGDTLDGDQNNITNVNVINANTITGLFQGTFEGDINGVNSQSLNDFFNNFELGTFNTNITNFYDYIKTFVDVDLGTIGSPTQINIDLGPSAII